MFLLAADWSIGLSSPDLVSLGPPHLSPLPRTFQALACSALPLPSCLSFPTQVTAGLAIVCSGQATITVCPASLHSLFISYSFPVATGSQKGRPFPSQLALLPPGRGGQLQAEEGRAAPVPSPVLSRGSVEGRRGLTAQPEAKARSFSVSNDDEDEQGRCKLLSDL